MNIFLVIKNTEYYNLLNFYEIAMIFPSWKHEACLTFLVAHL